MLSVTDVDKGYTVPMIITIVCGSRVSAQKLISNIELTRSHNVRNLLQHTELNISLRKSRLLLVFVVLGLRCLLDCHVLKGFGIYMIGILDRLY